MQTFLATALSILVVGAIFASSVTGGAEVEPPDPGYAVFANNLQLVDGECQGTVNVTYSFMTLDTAWGARWTHNETCVADIETFEYGDETFAYMVGGGAATAGFA